MKIKKDYKLALIKKYKNKCRLKMKKILKSQKF